MNTTMSSGRRDKTPPTVRQGIGRKGVATVTSSPVVVTKSSSKPTTIHEVKNVFISIPPELSATGFELKISGSIKLFSEGEGESKLLWDPEELTYQDVAALYSSQADGWTMIEEFVEPPEVIDTHDVEFPSSGLYPNLDLELPGSSKDKNQRSANKDTGLLSKKDGEAHVSGMTSNSSPSHVSTCDSPVNFHLADLKCLRELRLTGGVSTLTFFLKNGRELPTLHFHDGGTSSLLQSLQRSLYLVRDGRDSTLCRVEHNPVVQRSRNQHSRLSSGSDVTEVKKGVEGFLQTAQTMALEVGKHVRHAFKTERDLLEERPRVTRKDFKEDEKEEEDEILTITCKEVETPIQSKEAGNTVDPDMSLITDFQLITDLRGRLPQRPPIQARLPPLMREEWESYRQLDGTISNENEIAFRARVFAGGIDPSLRREVWKYLLGFFPFSSTDEERMDLQKRKEEEYDTIKRQWQTFTDAQENNFRRWRELKSLVEKDVLRTDRHQEMYHSLTSPNLRKLQDILNTYVIYNFDLGYVQGMSDLLSPILAVMENEADAFWCFVGLINRVGHHFEMSQETMRLRMKQLRALLNVSSPDFYQFLKRKDSSNLYFTFRWLIVDFKREFNFSNLMELWEVIWTQHLSVDYALFIALAIIDMEKEVLQNSKFDFSDIIEHINNLAHNLSVTPILQQAESICRQVARVEDLPEELQPLINNPFPPARQCLTSSTDPTVAVASSTDPTVAVANSTDPTVAVASSTDPTVAVTSSTDPAVAVVSSTNPITNVYKTDITLLEHTTPPPTSSYSDDDDPSVV